MELSVGIYIYYIIIGMSISYAIKAIRQIRSKDYDFFKRNLYTRESAQRWAVVDGYLKLGFCALCLVYGVLCIIGILYFWYVALGVAILLALYFILYRRILVRKEESQE